MLAPKSPINITVGNCSLKTKAKKAMLIETKKTLTDKKVKTMVELNIRLTISIVIIVLSICTVALADESSANNQSDGLHFSVFELIEALGVCALVSLLTTFLTGLFRRRLKRKFLKIHKIFAWLTIILALSHGITVMIVF